MVEKIIPVVFYVFICSAVSLVSPHLATSSYYVDSALCMTCHNHDSFLDEHDGYDCSICHYDVPGSDVFAVKCVECHPSGDPDGCNLVDDHQGITDCLACHVNQCGEGTAHIDTCLVCHPTNDLHERVGHSSCTQCHDQSTQGGVIEFLPAEPGKCVVCHPLDDPGKCNLAGNHESCIGCHTECTGDGTSTTTSVIGGHGESGVVDDTFCLTCHGGDNPYPGGEIHSVSAHTACGSCHDGASTAGNVNASACIVCHPFGNSGECNLVNLSDHALANCIDCHDECTGPSTTTTAASDAHLNRCLRCHSVNDIHGNSNHNDCAKCHDGGVNFNRCTACHSGCTLPISHGSSCLECHDECVGATTTTTASPYEEHLDVCLECHVVDDLHEKQGHNDCAKCHEGDEVAVGKCIVCHPLGSPGKCSLVNDHGSSCLDCHSYCSDSTTTTTAEVTSTTTTTNEFPEIITIDITLTPESVLRSYLIPYLLITVIKGTDSNFNCSTRVTFEDDAIVPPFYIILSSTRIIVFSLIRPAGIEAAEDSEVPVNVSTTVDLGGGESYEEVGGWYLTLRLMPWILGEGKEKWGKN